MITSFIFVNDGISYQYGIGKYISSLKETSPEIKRFRVNIVILGSKNVKEVSLVSETSNINLLYFPPLPYSSFKYQHIENAKHIVHTLETQFEFDSKTVFHFVAWCGIFIASVLKERYDNPIIYDLHCLEWQFALNGNKKKFASYWKTLKKDYGNPNSELVKPGAIYEKKLCDLADHIVVRTDQMKKDVVGTYKADRNKISVVYNGITPYWFTSGRENYFKQELGFGYNDKIILFVGRLSDQKGILYLIKAFKIVLSSYRKARLVIVGNGNYDDCLKECDSIWSKVVFTGRLGNEGLDRFYRIADIGVVPSIYEPFGYVLLEMMFRRIPVITTNIEGPDEIVDDGITGIKVNVKIDKDGERSIEPEELAEKILKLINDEKLASFLVRKALSKLRKQFLSIQMVRNLIKVYKNVLSVNFYVGKNTLETVEISGKDG